MRMRLSHITKLVIAAAINFHVEILRDGIMRVVN